MNFKVNAPGCPCDCSSPPSGPCGCSGDVTITISNAQALWRTIGVRFSPGPCNYMEFEGIDAIEGTYTITLGALNEEFELIRLAATNNPLMDDGFNEYCLFVRLRVEYIAYPFCQVAVFIEWTYQLLSGDTCLDIEDVDFAGAFAWSFNNNFGAPYELACVDTSGTVNVLTYVDPDPPGECDDQYYTFDYVIDYA